MYQKYRGRDKTPHITKYFKKHSMLKNASNFVKTIMVARLIKSFF
jgi:hypothetical protein